MLAIQQPTMTILAPNQQSANSMHDWLDFFDPQAALQSLINHVEMLPGARNERHTMRAYLSSLADYCRFHGAIVYHDNGESYDFRFSTMRQPSKASTESYIASLKRMGKSSSTVTRYMASIRHWLKALEEQQVIPHSGSDFVYIMESQRQFRLSVGVKNPPADTTSSRPALEQHGTRLNLMQVNQLFASFERGTADLPDLTTITGKRDLALLYIGITSGLRAAELARITLSSITIGKDCYEVKVRGKRSNTAPVGIDHTAYTLLMSYISAFNNALLPDDPRIIDNSTPVFQPLLRGDKLPALGLRNKKAQSGLTARAILKIVSRRSLTALGIEITAHDMRRTCAYLMRSHGFEWDQIRDQLRHKSIGTTEKYVGRELDLSLGLLSKRVAFELPK